MLGICLIFLQNFLGMLINAILIKKNVALIKAVEESNVFI